jgi:hypothetical protein
VQYRSLPSQDYEDNEKALARSLLLQQYPATELVDSGGAHGQDRGQTSMTWTAPTCFLLTVLNCSDMLTAINLLVHICAIIPVKYNHRLVGILNTTLSHRGWVSFAGGAVLKSVPYFERG